MRRILSHMFVGLVGLFVVLAQPASSFAADACHEEQGPAEQAVCCAASHDAPAHPASDRDCHTCHLCHAGGATVSIVPTARFVLGAPTLFGLVVDDLLVFSTGSRVPSVPPPRC